MEKSIKKNTIMKVIGNNIKILRLSKGMTQEQLAEKLEHSTNFVSLIELGKSGISIVTLIDICNILNVDINSLFSGLLDDKAKDNDQKIINNIRLLSENEKKIIDLIINLILNKNYP